MLCFVFMFKKAHMAQILARAEVFPEPENSLVYCSCDVQAFVIGAYQFIDIALLLRSQRYNTAQLVCVLKLPVP